MGLHSCEKLLWGGGVLAGVAAAMLRLLLRTGDLRSLVSRTAADAAGRNARVRPMTCRTDSSGSREGRGTAPMPGGSDRLLCTSGRRAMTASALTDPPRKLEGTSV